ncbi:MAG TPA: 50S ribosomal protein L30 [Longimicrobiales bacterium]|nr:50S ribosomal protein L30 [Longimicrobiales bacterium]
MAKKKEQQPGKLEITQVRSVSGRQETHRRTLRALGIKKNQTSVIQNDTPAIRGMINKIPHMITVREITE